LREDHLVDRVILTAERLRNAGIAVPIGTGGVLFAVTLREVQLPLLARNDLDDPLEGVLAVVPGARQLAFPVPRLPPLLSLVPVIAASEAARDAGDAAELEERALQLAGSVAAALVDARTDAAAPSRRSNVPGMPGQNSGSGR